MNTKQLTWPSIEEQNQFWIDKEAKIEKIIEDQFNRRLREITGLTGKLADVKLEAQANNATTETRTDKCGCDTSDWEMHYECHWIQKRRWFRKGWECLNCGTWVAGNVTDCKCTQRDISHLNHSDSTTADPKPKPILEALLNASESFEDIGGNELPDRIEANEDWYEAEQNNFDRGDLRDEGRNPDGSGESYAERNV